MTLPEIVVEDAGDGLTVAQVFELVTRTVLTAVLESDLEGLLPGDLGRELASELEGLAKVPLDKLEEATSTIDETARKLGSALEGLKGAAQGKTQGKAEGP